MEERFVDIEEATGSSPVPSTSSKQAGHEGHPDSIGVPPTSYLLLASKKGSQAVKLPRHTCAEALHPPKHFFDRLHDKQ